MRNYRAYDAVQKRLFLPFVFLPALGQAYTDFMAEYDPKVGFLIAKSKSDYFLYLGGYQYKLGLYKDKYTKLVVAFSVRMRDHISQKSTITMASESIRITGLSRDYFITDSQWPNFARSHQSNHFSSCCLRLDALFDAKKPTEAKTGNPLWQELLNVSEAKRDFASNFLIEWSYTHFVQAEKVEDGYLYAFAVAAPDATILQNEKRFDAFRRNHNLQNEDDENDRSLEALRESYINTLSAGSMVEIPLNRPPDQNGKQPMLYGTIKRLELPGVTHTKEGEPLKLEESFYSQDAHFNRPWVMMLFMKDDATVSVKDIASTNGVIKERVSTDYQHYKSALNAMTSPSANQSWTVAEQVLILNKLTPFSEGEKLNFFTKGLHKNQEDAIQLAVDAPDFCLIQGPPGTGKTTIITEMIRHFIMRGQRVLVCSKGNLAVDNVLEKWIKENKDRADGHLCVRLGDHYKLDFLKDYTPANVTARLQEKAYHKTQQERDYLAQQVESQIRLVETHKAAVSQLTALCIQFCLLADTLAQLCDAYQIAIARYKHRAGILPQKARSAARAYSIAYHELMLPCYRLLCSEAGPSSQQADRFDYYFHQMAEQIQSAMMDFRPGFFARLFAGKQAHAWIAMEEVLQNHYTALRAMDIQGSKLQGNPLATAQTLQLSGLSDMPSPQQLLAATRHLQGALADFSQREKQRLERIRTVLNDWLIELGSGVSSPLEKHVVLDSIPVIGSTCMGIMSDSDFNSITYDVVIVDEAGQIPIFDILVPIIKARKVVLIGDHLQLPPMDEDDFANYYASKKTGTTVGDAYHTCKQEVSRWYNMSLFERLYRASALDGAKIMLDRQYRMHPDISKFISQNFYNNNYHSGVTAEQRTLQIAGFHKPIYFYDTCQMPEQERAETYHNPGYSNETEAKHISDILVKLILAIREGNYIGQELVLRNKEDGSIIGYDIGVISGYKKQVNAIYSMTRQKLEKYISADEAQLHMDRFMISSVDSFQGRDNQIILFSMTRSNKEGKIGFLKDVRRLNVAMTRAKSLLIMVGDSATLTACDAMCAHDSSIAVSQIYKNLLAYCREKEYYHPLKGGTHLGTQ